MKTIILNGQTQPVGNIFCIGRNYHEHIRELRNTRPTEPVVFLKPTSSLLHSGGLILLPPESQDVHHECEWVVYIGHDTNHIAVDTALDYVAGYGIGLDLTARDIQSILKTQGLPWTAAKGFRTSACVSEFVTAASVSDIQSQTFSLYVNGQLRQSGDSSLMIFSVAEQIAYLSRHYGLQAGDLIYTGTPAGVAAIHPGDHLELNWHGHVQASFDVAAA